MLSIMTQGHSYRSRFFLGLRLLLRFYSCAASNVHISLNMESQSGLFTSLKSTFSISNIIWLVSFWVAYRILIALYNISPLHPLYRFPGPKIASASYLYEAYYDWWLLGRYGKVIAHMHKQYGPIVRINPDELHCSDPAFTDEIYAGPGRVRDKWQHQLNTGGAGPVSVTGFSTVPHELHRARKAPLARFFSRQQMLKLEGEVYDFAQATTNKMLASAGKCAFDVKEAFNCFTADVIAQYAFGEPMGFVAQEGWEPNFASWVKSFFKSAYMMRHNALARKIAQVMPFAADYLGEDIRTVMQLMNVTIPGYIRDALKDPDNGRVFADMMSNPEALSAEEKYRFSGEGFNFLLAGTETTAVCNSSTEASRSMTNDHIQGDTHYLHILGPCQAIHLQASHSRPLKRWAQRSKSEMAQA